MSILTRVMRDGAVFDSLDPADRGLAYGDGLFETMRVHRGQPVWWQEHWRRLQRGAERLGLPMPDEHAVRRECEQLFGDAGDGVFKIILTCGAGGRGYTRPERPSPTVVLSRHALPVAWPDPIAIRWCRTPLAIQPALAGIKHLNRLEQVLARREWSDPAIAEGLMRDTEDRVVCATAANLFILHRGRWLTPNVQRCGVAGIARGWLLENVAGSAEADLGAAEVSDADAVFLCNAVRGILPVARLGQREWTDHDATRRLRLALAQAQPAFAIQE